MITDLKIRLDNGPQAVSAARLALDALEPHVSSAQLDDLRLLVSELVTNSVRHAAGGSDDEVRLEVAVGEDVLRAEVVDSGPGFEATPRGTEDDIGSGWGLYLVETLADRWGVETDHVTCVWFELDRTNGSRVAA
ncbi:MAG TPA: ATP-binding protein [Thermoleophilaceae bacterium]